MIVLDKTNGHSVGSVGLWLVGVGGPPSIGLPPGRRSEAGGGDLSCAAEESMIGPSQRPSLRVESGENRGGSTMFVLLVGAANGALVGRDSLGNSHSGRFRI